MVRNGLLCDSALPGIEGVKFREVAGDEVVHLLTPLARPSPRVLISGSFGEGIGQMQTRSTGRARGCQNLSVFVVGNGPLCDPRSSLKPELPYHTAKTKNKTTKKQSLDKARMCKKPDTKLAMIDLYPDLSHPEQGTQTRHAKHSMLGSKKTNIGPLPGPQPQNVEGFQTSKLQFCLQLARP